MSKREPFSELARQLVGVPITVDALCEDGHVYAIGNRYFTSPLTAFAMAHEGRRPFESRYSLGVIEAGRARRRRSRR